MLMKSKESQHLNYLLGPFGIVNPPKKGAMSILKARSTLAKGHATSLFRLKIREHVLLGRCAPVVTPLRDT